jgi:hypothetical protein
MIDFSKNRYTIYRDENYPQPLLPELKKIDKPLMKVE